MPVQSARCMQDLALHVQHSTFEAFLEARRQRDEAKIVAELREHQNKQLATDETTGHGFSVAKLRKRVIEEILTLQCPRCGQAWNEFDACVAVKCQRCNAGFCGICMQDCGADAHAHARACKYVVKYTRGRATMNETDIPCAQNDWRRDALQGLLGPVQADITATVLLSLKAELRDLGLDASSVQGGMPQAQSVMEVRPDLRWRVRTLTMQLSH